MEVTVLSFGPITDVFGSAELVIHGTSNTAELIDQLTVRYPQLASLNYIVAIDKKIINKVTDLKNGNVVALLPPFSGG